MNDAITTPKPHVYVRNMRSIFKGHFTSYSQLYLNFYLKIEAMGYKIPEVGIDNQRIRPHKDLDASFLVNMIHYHRDLFNECIRVQFVDEEYWLCETDRQYSNKLLPFFMQCYEHWLKHKAKEYFREKDPNVLEYLPKLLLEYSDDNPSVEQLKIIDDLDKEIEKILERD